MGAISREFFEKLGAMPTVRGIGQCLGKIAYGSATSAETALKYMQRRSGRAKMDVYRCSDCRNWHIGSQWDTNAKQTQARKRKSFTPPKGSPHAVG